MYYLHLCFVLLLHPFVASSDTVNSITIDISVVKLALASWSSQTVTEDELAQFTKTVMSMSLSAAAEVSILKSLTESYSMSMNAYLEEQVYKYCRKYRADSLSIAFSPGTWQLVGTVKVTVAIGGQQESLTNDKIFLGSSSGEPTDQRIQQEWTKLAQAYLPSAKYNPNNPYAPIVLRITINTFRPDRAWYIVNRATGGYLRVGGGSDHHVFSGGRADNRAKWTITKSGSKFVVKNLEFPNEYLYWRGVDGIGDRYAVTTVASGRTCFMWWCFGVDPSSCPMTFEGLQMENDIKSVGGFKILGADSWPLKAAEDEDDDDSGDRMTFYIKGGTNSDMSYWSLRAVS